MGSPLEQRAADFRGADQGPPRGVPVCGKWGLPQNKEQRILEGRIGGPRRGGGPCVGRKGQIGAQREGGSPERGAAFFDTTPPSLSITATLQMGCQICLEKGTLFGQIWFAFNFIGLEKGSK